MPPSGPRPPYGRDVTDTPAPTPAKLAPLGQGCGCVEEHEPRAYVPNRHHIKPESWGGPTTDENLVTLCPNTHTATHRLIDEYVRTGGIPPWSTREHFGPLARALAEKAWELRPSDRPPLTMTYDEHGHTTGFAHRH